MFHYLAQRLAGLLFQLRCATRNLRDKGRPNIATVELPIRPRGTKPFVIGLRRDALSDTHTLLERSPGGEGLDEAARLVEEALGTKIEVYDNGQGPPVAQGVHARGSVIVCMKEEDVASEVRRLRAVYKDAPILVLGLSLQPRLARSALLAGADGFVYPGMQPVQIVKLLEVASGGESLLPRELLEAFLVETQSQADLAVLSPRQQEILILIAEAATSKGEIALSKELLEDFLTEVAMAA
jgi:DNA-binding NarL/FixJ family response regulator